MARIVHATAADADLEEIWSYIADDNVRAADKLLERIAATFDLLAVTPDLGFNCDQIRPGVRCKPVTRNYLVFYRVTGNDVIILRVLHSARKPDNLL